MNRVYDMLRLQYTSPQLPSAAEEVIVSPREEYPHDTGGTCSVHTTIFSGRCCGKSGCTLLHVHMSVRQSIWGRRRSVGLAPLLWPTAKSSVF